MFYQKILRPLLFTFTDPEKVHHRVIRGLSFFSRRKFFYSFIRSRLNVSDQRLEVKLGSLTLPNPIGLAAGFDKYIEAPLAYPMLGFGFAELGSITYSEQPGNPKPRLWRLPEDQGLIVYYGLSNNGAEYAAGEMSKISEHIIPYGFSIAPTTGVVLKDMPEDILKSIEKLARFADYITLNVSCPNVANNDSISQVSFIEELTEKAAEKMRQLGLKKDLFIKIGPHHTPEELNTIVAACIRNGFTGIVATNLVKKRHSVSPKSKQKRLDHPGGISGKLVASQSDATIKTLYQYSGGKLKIIGVGGVFTAEDAYHKIRLGASAVQIITGFIYGGPSAMKNINLGILKLLERDKFNSISDAVGIDAQ